MDKFEKNEKTYLVEEQAYCTGDSHPYYEAKGIEEASGNDVFLRWEIYDKFLEWDDENLRYRFVHSHEGVSEDQMCDWTEFEIVER